MLKIRSKFYLALVLLPLVFFAAGCKTTLVVHNADVKTIIPIFKDYAGVHGYAIKYANDQTGAYNLDMGAVYVAGSSYTSQSTTFTQSNPVPGQPMTGYEQSTWNTVNNADHYVEAMAAVNIVQQGTDVMVSIDTNDAGGSSLNDMVDYLKTLGYSVDNR
jgi:hypothetical protein